MTCLIVSEYWLHSFESSSTISTLCFYVTFLYGCEKGTIVLSDSVLLIK